MRRRYLFLLLFIYTTCAFAANVTQVSFTSPTPVVTNIQIANLADIKSIYTAGSYAWATDGINAAFYDGTQWKEGVSLPDVTAINNIYPAYPTNGITSEAWADVTTGNGPGVAYFDGTNWHTPELVANILGMQQSGVAKASITTSGGAVFLLAVSPIDYNTTHYSIKASATSAWNQAQTLPGMYTFNLYDAFDDQNPILNFMVNEHVSENSYLYRLAVTGANAGKAIIEPNAFPAMTSIYVPILTTDGSRLFVVYNDGASSAATGNRMFAFKDFSTQTTWQQTPNYPASLTISTPNSLTATDNENNGFICEVVMTGMSGNSTIACLDTNKPGSYWLPIYASITYSNEWQLLASSHGAWIAYNQSVDSDHVRPIIESYDNNTFSTVDTRFPPDPFLFNQLVQVTQVGDSGLLACRGMIVIQHNVPTYPIKLYYYDKKNNVGWQSLDVGDTALTSCGFSLGGTPTHSLHRVSGGGTLWIYNNAPPVSAKE